MSHSEPVSICTIPIILSRHGSAGCARARPTSGLDGLRSGEGRTDGPWRPNLGACRSHTLPAHISASPMMRPGPARVWRTSSEVRAEQTPERARPPAPSLSTGPSLPACLPVHKASSHRRRGLICRLVQPFAPLGYLLPSSLPCENVSFTFFLTSSNGDWTGTACLARCCLVGRCTAQRRSRRRGGGRADDDHAVAIQQDVLASRQTGIQAGRQAGRQADRQAGRQAGRQAMERGLHYAASSGQGDHH